MSGDPVVACGNQTDPRFRIHRDKIRNVGFILSKPLGRIDFPMCPGI